MMKNETIQTSLPGLETEEEIEGVVERIVFTNEASPFTVFSFKPLRKNSRITALANVEAPLVGQQLRLRGHWTQHKRYGQQFQVTGLRIEAPSSAEGIERFLASGVVDGIGPSLAKRIVQKFGKKTLTVIEQTPHRLSEVAGIGKKTIEKITASYASQSELRDIMLWLETHHISGTYAARIFKKYGSFSIDTSRITRTSWPARSKASASSSRTPSRRASASPRRIAVASLRVSTLPCRRSHSRGTAASLKQRLRSRQQTSSKSSRRRCARS